MSPTDSLVAWWQEGVRFECQGTGKCCTSHGAYGHIYLTLEDRRVLAAHLGLRTSVFTRRFCVQAGDQWHLKDPEIDCVFLQGTRCGVYAARPTQCRTWPFWPENMKARVWRKEIATFCAGVGRGPVIAPETIRSLLALHRQ